MAGRGYGPRLREEDPMAHWPESDCDGKKAGDRLEEIVEKALAQNPQRWDVIFFAAQCGLAHTIPSSGTPTPNKDACDLVKMAEAAAELNQSKGSMSYQIGKH